MKNSTTEKLQELLKCDYKKLRELTTYDAVSIVGDITLQALNKKECYSKKDTMAKGLYNSLFHYLVTLQSNMENVDKKKTY